MSDEFDPEEELRTFSREVMNMPNVNTRGFKLKCTCIAAPLQYEFFDKDGNQVGYFRYRHEALTVRSPDHRGTLLMRLFLTNPRHDPELNIKLLNLAALHIEAFLKGKKS